MLDKLLKVWLLASTNQQFKPRLRLFGLGHFTVSCCDLWTCSPGARHACTHSPSNTEATEVPRMLLWGAGRGASLIRKTDNKHINKWECINDAKYQYNRVMGLKEVGETTCILWPCEEGLPRKGQVNQDLTDKREAAMQILAKSASCARIGSPDAQRWIP